MLAYFWFTSEREEMGGV